MKLLLSFTFLLFCFQGFCQKDTVDQTAQYYMKWHNAKVDTVMWLCEYDNIAWWTSDSVSASPKEEREKLGTEWFCFKKNGIWHAAYGKVTDGIFNLVFHYEVDSNSIVKRVFSSVDTLTSNSYARALKNGITLRNNYPDSIRVRFNQYIRRNPDRSLSVWFFPAFTTNGIAVYGGEFYYLFDETGNNLLLKNEYSQGYRGLRPDTKKEVWLDYTDRDDPTLGAIFFVYYYRQYFDRIVADAKKFRSTLFHDKEKGYYWVNAVK